MKLNYTIVLLILVIGCSSCSKNIDEPKKTINVDILLAGSSTMEFWIDYQDYFVGYSVINTGIGSATTETILNSFSTTFANNVPKYSVLYLGENDVLLLTHELFTQNIKLLVNKIFENSPKTKIIFISIKPGPGRKELWSTFIQYNETLKELENYHKDIFYIDFFNPLFTDVNNVDNSFFRSDGVHLSIKGYTLLADKIHEKIKIIAKNENDN